MPQISFVARSFIQERLLDSDTGFNFWLNFVAQDYPNVESFTLTQGTNLFIGAFDADQLDQSDDTVYPFCVLSSKKATNQNVVTPNEFGGVLISTIDFYTGFKKSEPPFDAESLADAIEDAMYETFNNQAYYGLEQGSGLSYNNEMDAVRFPMQFGGENWRQKITFTLAHHYITMGRSV